jgi:hypothetical protein
MKKNNNSNDFSFSNRERKKEDRSSWWIVIMNLFPRDNPEKVNLPAIQRSENIRKWTSIQVNKFTVQWVSLAAVNCSFHSVTLVWNPLLRLSNWKKWKLCVLSSRSEFELQKNFQQSMPLSCYKQVMQPCLTAMVQCVTLKSSWS